MSTENELTVEELERKLKKQLCANLLSWAKHKSKTDKQEYLIQLIREYIERKSVS